MHTLLMFLLFGPRGAILSYKWNYIVFFFVLQYFALSFIYGQKCLYIVASQRPQFVDVVWRKFFSNFYRSSVLSIVVVNSDGSVNSFSWEIHSQKCFDIVFTESYFTSVLSCEILFTPDSHTFWDFLWNHAEIYNLFTKDLKKLGKLSFKEITYHAL